MSENGRTTTTLQIKEDQVFDAHGPLPSLGQLKPEFRSDDIRIPVFAIVYGILVNSQLVTPADEPKSWLDLTDPRWKGKILSDDFRALGGGGVLFYVLQETFGRDFHEKLAAQELKFSREIPANERRIARGEYPLYIPVSSSAMPPLKGLREVLSPNEGCLHRLRPRVAQEGTASERGALLMEFTSVRKCNRLSRTSASCQ